MYECVHVQHVSMCFNTRAESRFNNIPVQAHTERGKWKAQHRDPQTLNGVGVKGLVGERRRKSLLWLSPPYREETKGNIFRRQHISDTYIYWQTHTSVVSQHIFDLIVTSWTHMPEFVFLYFKPGAESRLWNNSEYETPTPTLSLLSLVIAAALSSLESVIDDCFIKDRHEGKSLTNKQIHDIHDIHLNVFQQCETLYHLYAI